MMENAHLPQGAACVGQRLAPVELVHVRGAVAHGYFECSLGLPDLTQASPLSRDGRRTPVSVRFSTLSDDPAAADTVRGARGFDTRFHTEDGDWDLLGSSIPVLAEAEGWMRGMPQAGDPDGALWALMSRAPEGVHHALWLMSDHGLPRSYRTMQGFGVHTFRLQNSKGEAIFARLHWLPVAGTHSLVGDEAARIASADPDFLRRDLWEAIEAGRFPEYELALQVFTEEQAKRFSFDALDPTKLVPEEIVPLGVVGRMVLNRNPESFFAESTLEAFRTTNAIPGIEVARRTFDGSAQAVTGGRVDDACWQASLFWHSQTPGEQRHAIAALCLELSRVPLPTVRARVLSLLAWVDPQLAAAVSEGLGIAPGFEPEPRVLSSEVVRELGQSASLSLLARPGKLGAAGRRVAILLEDGVDIEAPGTVRRKLLEVGAAPRWVGAHLGLCTTVHGGFIEMETTFEAMPSALWDAVVVLRGDGRTSAAMAAFVREQYRHGKPMLIVGADAPWLQQAGVMAAPSDPGVVAVPTFTDDALNAFVKALGCHRNFERTWTDLAV